MDNDKNTNDIREQIALNNLETDNDNKAVEEKVDSEDIISQENALESDIDAETSIDTDSSADSEELKSPVYSYTAGDNGMPSVEEDRYIPYSESNPTVTFDTVTKPIENGSNLGLKVFFAIIAITISLVIAVAAGFVFGSKTSGSFNNGAFGGSTSLSTRGDSTVANDKIKVFNNVNDSIVAITVYTSKGIQGYASGVVYTTDGYIITNDHIYSEVASPEFLITFANGSEYKADFVAGDTRSDLAVLKVNATGFKKADFADSDEISIGEDVIAVGYPQGAEGKSILTSGTISSKGVRVSATSSYSMKMIQTDTAINPGNSGGALVDMYSKVIGITSVKLAGTQYDNVGYAIPSKTVVKIVDSLIKNKYVEGRGRLGIQYTAVNSIMSEQTGVPTGLQVAVVDEDSQLYTKIKKNDIITHINDVKITESNTALDIIENTAPGVTMSFTVYHVSDKTTETVYASLLPDQGGSSYVNKIADEGTGLPFGNGSEDDFFSDH